MGYTALLHLVCVGWVTPALVCCLIEGGADARVCDNIGANALHKYCFIGVGADNLFFSLNIMLKI